ncbi:RNA polymerase sigma-70 factor [Spirosoma agri]|uniref:RNA polymerase sigma-70 factor n=1 Tax=Spirosoma agri TaxID=1987381 RepID=A0A6M0IQY1_9BACT|nr:RNA polymerase sigma-70 factor [Spirosoma agri]NEU70352.1 RNA polymerase sigma-70 factor [Spirosoma agri]
MSENIPNKPTTANPFGKPASDPIVVDTEFLIREAFAEDVRMGYELLFRRYYRTLCSHAVRFVHSRTIAEDLVSEVFLSFWKNQVHQHITTSYQAYLYAAVRKRAYTHLRQEFQPETLTDQTEADASDAAVSLDPEQLLQYTELAQRIEETVRTLPPQCQRVFVMSRFEGKKHREIADELHISPKTIEAHLSRALTQLRQTLQLGLFAWLLLLFATSLSNLPIAAALEKMSVDL